MSWYKVTITADQAASDYHGKLQDEFEKVFMKSTNRQEMALFDGEWSTADHYNIYFSPACARNAAMNALMERYSAKPCNEPTRMTEKGLVLLVGDQNKWDTFVWQSDLI
jgi:hypothetical protein